MTHSPLQQVPVQNYVVFVDSKQKIPRLRFVSITVDLCYHCDSLLVSLVSIFCSTNDFQVLDHIQMLLASHVFVFYHFFLVQNVLGHPQEPHPQHVLLMNFLKVEQQDLEHTGCCSPNYQENFLSDFSRSSPRPL